MRRTKIKRNRKSKKQQEFINSLLFFVVTLLSISSLLTYLWVYNEVNITDREISGLKRIQENIAVENREIRSEIGRLSRIDRITEIARKELQMVTPEPESLVVFVDKEILRRRIK
ncbi:MAG: cell division protein FtsL [Candidatus Marinimicrobia bacterium]|nr:cell division protein FtsL [Candidatus Neomarinimicrobiota bacterium]